ncbi:phosphatidylglycerophosphatase A [Roseicyclus sp. F158]|uniref:Phosphatidylglycerophosphatase A n=1 Tax=Tropicimonas omnivorans TaxID=3075590 RepID=A0ABU3DJT1_9RHOB|nr:phosphatidylglycerophosphatase A [Roseicyclus sp. F158]MDT0683975.1 phosphatidylglycerophosphatase A [Roseicyclus sp. F158]
MTRFIASFAYSGLISPANGTWGSAAALLVGYLLHGLGGFPLLLVAAIALFWVGLWAARAETRSGDHDPSWIVVDEAVGMWIALLPLSGGLWFAGADPWLFPWPGWVGAFAMFRLFDIWKPWLVGRADRMGTPEGLMLDDVAAGIMAAIVVALAAAISHGVLMS